MNGLCVRWTPVVCTGVVALVCAPPNNSVKPPNADKLVNAFNAPGFDRSCANGIALARGEADTAAAAEDAGVGVAVVPPPLVGLLVWVASRLAFCSSTLKKRKETKTKRKKEL